MLRPYSDKSRQYSLGRASAPINSAHRPHYGSPNDISTARGATMKLAATCNNNNAVSMIMTTIWANLVAPIV